MKEFEKWWDEFGQYEFSTYLTKDQSKVIWKAALEWAKQQLKDDVNGYFNICKELEE